MGHAAGDASEDQDACDGIDSIVRNGPTFDPIGLDDWRVDVDYPEDRERAEALLRDEASAAVEE